MRHIPSKAQALSVAKAWAPPRGWVVLSAALAGWALVAIMVSGLGRLFTFVAAAL